MFLENIIDGWEWGSPAYEKKAKARLLAMDARWKRKDAKEKVGKKP
jgi:hypothetical protein